MTFSTTCAGNEATCATTPNRRRRRRRSSLAPAAAEQDVARGGADDQQVDTLRRRPRLECGNDRRDEVEVSPRRCVEEPHRAP